MLLEHFFKTFIKGLKSGYILVIILMTIVGIMMFQVRETVNSTNELVIQMDNRYYDDIYEKGATVMNTLVDQGFNEHNEIRDFLSQKPAGRSDLKKAISIEKTYCKLVEEYGELANVAKRAVDF